MATNRNARIYPLQLKSGSAINVSIKAAYDFAGDPDNGYAGGDGLPHVGDWTLTKSAGAEFPVITAAPGILGRDLSQGMRTDVRQAYFRQYADKLGIGSADGKGNFTLHYRFRNYAAYTGTTGARALSSIYDGSGAKIRLIAQDNSAGYVYYYWELSPAQSAATNIPSLADRITQPFLRVPHGAIVDLHLVRNGDDIFYFINGSQVASLNNPNYVLNSAAWAGSTTGNLGATGATPADLIAVDMNTWSRALSPAEVQEHYADPYAGYVSTVAAPVVVAPSAPTAVTASAGVNQVSVSGTPGSDGGEAVSTYTARVYAASGGALLKTVSGATLPITVTGVAAGAVTATLTATNSKGTSPESAASNTVTVTDPVVVTPPPPTGTTPVRYDFPASYAILAAPVDPPSGITSVVVAPDGVTLDGGTVRQFNVTVAGTSGFNPAVTWTATAGSINSFGTFTGPAATTADQQILVRATSVQDPTKWGEATVIILGVAVAPVDSVVVSPAAVTVAGGSQQQFTATVNGPGLPDQAVEWTSTAGLISDLGILTAPQTATFEQTLKVRATSVLDPEKWGEADVKILAVAIDEVQTVLVSPAVVNVRGGESVQFESEVAGPNNPSQAVTWSTTIGTINADGVAKAPAAGPREQVGTVTATSVQDPTKKGTAVFVVDAGMATAFTPSVSRQVRILPGRLAYAVGSHWTLGTAGPVGGKDPNSAIDIPFDWTEWLADIGNPPLKTIEFLLGGGLVSDGVVPNAKGGTVVVSGGSLQQTGTVTCRITTETTPPRTEDRTVVLQMKEQ